MHEPREDIVVSQPRLVKPAVAWAGAIFVGLLTLAALSKATYQWATQPSPAQARTTKASSPAHLYRVDINHAPAKDLAVLPGIGPTLAKRIVRYRQQFGPFTRPEQLQAVSRIGPATRQRIEPWIRLPGPKRSTIRLANQRP